MAGLPDWVSDVPAVGKWVAGTVAGFVGLVSGWSFLGMPIPATQNWVIEYYEREAVEDELIEAIARNDKALRELEEGEGRTALLEQRALLCDRLQEISGITCRGEPSQ